MSIQFAIFVLITITSQMAIVPSEAFLDGFAHSIGQMNNQLTKFVEGLQESVDSWASKVIDNANKEECFYICPKGQDPVLKTDYNFTPSSCSTFGIQIKDEDLPAKRMRICCEEQQTCYHRCNASKIECDYGFQNCLHTECVKISKDAKQLNVCDTATKLLLMGILSFGCKTYKDAQREACICPPVVSKEL